LLRNSRTLCRSRHASVALGIRLWANST
jgi:hypothetical protein